MEKQVLNNSGCDIYQNSIFVYFLIHLPKRKIHTALAEEIHDHQHIARNKSCRTIFFNVAYQVLIRKIKYLIVFIGYHSCKRDVMSQTVYARSRALFYRSELRFVLAGSKVL